jgi:pyruvate kinase
MISLLTKNKLVQRKTKIICTIGPSSKTETIIKKMILEGMDIARFNFSHGHLEEFRRWAKIIRKLSRRLKRKVEIIQDLQGPRIRIGKLSTEGRHINVGSKVTLVFGDNELGRGEIPVKSDVEINLKKGDKILMDKGLIELEVRRSEKDKTICKALTSGVVFSGKGINIPSIQTNEAFTKKDLEDLEEGLRMGVDYIALSFVEEAQDIKNLREIVKDRAKIIAKIERPQAIQNYEEILEVSDAVMIARGDLGIEIPFWKLPIIQKRAIRRAVNANKPSIVATDMLASMAITKRPTRAEILDVANAVIDGASAVMLSDETAVGKHPLCSVEVMRKIVEEAEGFVDGQRLKSLL